MNNYETASADELINECYRKAGALTDKDMRENYLAFALQQCITELTKVRDQKHWVDKRGGKCPNNVMNMK